MSSVLQQEIDWASFVDKAREGFFWWGRTLASIPGLNWMWRRQNRLTELEWTGAKLCQNMADGPTKSCLIRLADDGVLRVPLNMKGLSARRLQSAVALQLTRLSPLSPKVIYWAVADIKEADSHLVLARRSTVNAALEAARHSGWQPERVIVVEEADEREAVLWQAGLTRMSWKVWAPWLALLLSICAVLAAGMWRQDRHISVLEGQLEALGSQLSTLEVAQGEDGYLTTAEEQAKLGAVSVTQALRKIAAVLPDQDWVRHISKVGPLWEIRGISLDAPGLPDRFEQAGFKVVSSGPYQAVPGSDAEHFTIKISPQEVSP